MNPTCGLCNKVMTPDNSQLAPELFVCDECVNKDDRLAELRKSSATTSPSPTATTNGEEEREQVVATDVLRAALQEIITEDTKRVHSGMREGPCAKIARKALAELEAEVKP